MTLADLHELLLDNGIPVSDNNDFQLFTADGLPIIGVHRIGDELYLSDTVEGYTEED